MVPEGYHVRLKVRGREEYIDERLTWRQVQARYGLPRDAPPFEPPVRYERNTLPGLQLVVEFQLCDDGTQP
jgi:hypothetical protein